jgi:glutamine amidotransferase
MIGVVDYGAGNLRNVQAALARLGAPWRSVARPEDLAGISALILPGVGRFGAAMQQLREAGLVEPLQEFAASGRPLLGICLGMQILFEASDEDAGAAGLGVIPGRVARLESPRLPHIGWATVEPEPRAESLLFTGLPPRFYAYFAHSYALPAGIDQAAAHAAAPPRFTCSVRAGSILGTQFHPEKSGTDGQRMLANFARLSA